MIDVKFILLNKLIVLLLILLFFFAIFLLNRVFKKDMSYSSVSATIKLCIIGLITLYFEYELSAIPIYGKVAKTVQGIVVIVCFANFLNYLIIDLYLYYKTGKKVPSFLRDIVRIFVYLILGMASLRLIFNIEISSIMTTSAVLTAAVAFAMQNTLSNVISGFSIQLDKNLKRNTWIDLKDKDIVGEIINVGFRYTTLKTIENKIIIVPNNVILQNVVTSWGSAEEKAALSLKIGLPYEMPPEKAKALMADILSSNIHILTVPPYNIYVFSYLESCIEYEMRFFVDFFANKDEIKNDVLTKIWYGVIRSGYDFPFPHREIIMKSPKRPFKVEKNSILNLLKEIEILSSLTDNEIESVYETANIKVYAPGEVIVRQQEEGQSLFIVTDGLLKVYIDNSVVGSIHRNEIFGEMSLLTGEKRNATVIADSEVHIIEITKEGIEPIIKKNPEFLDTLSLILTKREERNIELKKMVGEQVGSKDGKKEEFLKKLKKFFGLK